MNLDYWKALYSWQRSLKTSPVRASRHPLMRNVGDEARVGVHALVYYCIVSATGYPYAFFYEPEEATRLWPSLRDSGHGNCQRQGLIFLFFRLRMNPMIIWDFFLLFPILIDSFSCYVKELHENFWRGWVSSDQPPLCTCRMLILFAWCKLYPPRVLCRRISVLSRPLSNHWETIEFAADGDDGARIWSLSWRSPQILFCTR